MRVIQCILISVFAVLSASGTAPWGGFLGKYLLQRPFIGGLICGIILGNIQQGIMIGAAMQLVYIGYFNVGGVQAIDLGIISFPCVAIAMMANIETTAAIALATGLGTLFTSLEMVSRTALLPACGALMKKGCEEGDDKKIFLGYWVLPTIIYTVTRGVTSFLLMYFGSEAVGALVAALPTSIMDALKSVGGFLPCIGMATLLVYLAKDAWSLVIFALGFACYGYLGLTSTSILLFALMLAYLYYRAGKKAEPTPAGNAIKGASGDNLQDEEVL